MEYRSIKGYNGWGQLGMLLVFLGAGFILAAIVQFAIFYTLVPSGTDLGEIATQMTALIKDPKNMRALQLSQVVGTFFLFFVPAILYNRLVNGKDTFWLGFNKYFTTKQVIIGAVAIFLANIVAGPLADMSKEIVAHLPSLKATAEQLEKAYNEQLMAMSNLQSWGDYIIAIFIIAFFPAVFEEVFFRGVLQDIFVRWWKAPLVGIIVASLIFSLIHMSVYLFIPRFVLGLVLGLLYHYSKNIWVNIFAHFINNALAITQLFYLNKNNKLTDPSQVDPSFPWWAGVIAAAGVVAIFYYFKQISTKQVLQIETKEAVLSAVKDPFHGYAQKDQLY